MLGVVAMGAPVKTGAPIALAVVLRELRGALVRFGVLGSGPFQSFGTVCGLFFFGQPDERECRVARCAEVVAVKPALGVARVGGVVNALPVELHHEQVVASMVMLVLGREQSGDHALGPRCVPFFSLLGVVWVVEVGIVAEYVFGGVKAGEDVEDVAELGWFGVLDDDPQGVLVGEAFRPG